MQAGRRYTLFQTVNWQKKSLLLFAIWSSVPVILHTYFHWEWLHMPWQPISLIGIAVAFYLGFKNNSSYERLWEARKIWGGIVNSSRSFTVMARDFVNNETTVEDLSDTELKGIRKRIVHRHVAWLHALTYHLRKLKAWEHHSAADQAFREYLDPEIKSDKYQQLKPYLSESDHAYILSKGNRPSHLLSSQSKDLMALRQAGVIEHFRHLAMQDLITEFYTLQGKAERIKNFPFPRQYATVNYFFVVLFIVLLPFGMLNVFTGMESENWTWLAIPFSTLGAWVFWMMEVIGDYSENPFEGLYNDIPISAMATGIEIDIRQMLDETDLPEPVQPIGEMKILM